MKNARYYLQSLAMKRAHHIWAMEKQMPFDAMSWSECLKQGWAEVKSLYKVQTVTTITKDTPAAIQVPAWAIDKSGAVKTAVWIPKTVIYPDNTLPHEFWKKKVQQYQRENRSARFLVLNV